MKTTEVSVPVFSHTKRPEWGMALLAWERHEKRGFLFEDGALRVIAEPYYSLMQLIQVEQTALSAAFRHQISQMSMEKTNGVLGSNREISTVFSVEEQAQLLVAQFPGGFAGEEWHKRHRGDGKKKRLKRHRTAAIVEASQVFAPERFERANSEHRHEELWEEICGVLQATDLVPPSEIKAFRQRLHIVNSKLTLSLVELLRSAGSDAEDSGFGTHFSNFVAELQSVLGSTPSWPLVTSLLSLSMPQRHICVHPGSLRQQSRWMGERPVRSSKPNARDYEAARATACRLFEKLRDLELGPTDLLDVYDFVRVSTTPTAKKRLETLRQSALGGANGMQTADHAETEASEGDDEDVAEAA